MAFFFSLFQFQENVSGKKAQSLVWLGRGEREGEQEWGLGGPGEEVCSPRLLRARRLCLHLWNVADSLWGEPCAATAADIWRLNSRRRQIPEADANFEGQTE